MRDPSLPETVSAPVPNSVVLSWDADLDMSTIECFRRLCRDALAEGATTGVVVLDLSHTEFVSVEGTFALVQAKDLATSRGIDLRVVTATRGVERALAATGARCLFACHPTVDAAVAAQCATGHPPR